VSVSPRIASIENLVASDPGQRNVFGLMVADQLRLAAQSLRLARRVAIVSGFFIPEAGAGETDGPPGAKVVGHALRQLSIPVDYMTDACNAPLFRALGIDPITNPAGYLESAMPTHLLSIERVGRGADGRYRNMRGNDISAHTAPLDELFLEGSRRGISTIGIGDGGNEIGMGKVFADALATIEHGPQIASTILTDFCIAAGVSNWGAYGLAGALSVLEGRDLLPSGSAAMEDLDRVVSEGGAVDGVTQRREPTVDGLASSHSLRMLEGIRRHIAPSPLTPGRTLTVGVLGHGEAGRAAAALLSRHGHRVRVSDVRGVTIEPGTVIDGVETGGHTIEFLARCDLVVASPGVRPDTPILDALHHEGIPVMSELEMAYQLCDRDLIAVTGTVGKRSTVEILQRLFTTAGRALPIGGNRGRSLSGMLLDEGKRVDSSEDRSYEPMGVRNPMAVAVSSFQLDNVIHFRPHVAVFLNINEAHLDRHRSIAEYVRTKSRIFMNHRPDDVLILNFDDPRVRPVARKHRGRTFFVSRTQEVDRGAWLRHGDAHLNVDGRLETLGPMPAVFPENLLASMVAARLCGVSVGQLSSALRGLP
jgi:hypothetical protein